MERIFRVGKVIKTSGSKVKVHFEDVNIESDWLVCVGGRGYIVGTVVLCAFNLGFNEQGYVLGVIS